MELVARGHDVTVFTYHLGEDRALGGVDLRRIDGVAGYERLSPGPDWTKITRLDTQLAAKLLREVRRDRFDVIHAHHVEGIMAALPAARLRKLPIVYDIHTLVADELPYYADTNWRRFVASKVGCLVDRRMPSHADHVVAVTDDIARFLRERASCSAQDVSVVPNGVELAAFRAGGLAGNDASAIGTELVYSGNLSEYQGIPLLLEGFAWARRDRPGLRLRLLTDDCFDAYLPLLRSLDIEGAVEVAPADIATLPSQLAGALAVVNPRVDCPGLPQKLLNYMASGAAIISFAGSAKHLSNELNALIVPDHDVVALGRAMVRLADDPALSMRLRLEARLHAEREFSWTLAAERIERAYDCAQARHRLRRR